MPSDNAAMVAWASLDRFLSGDTDPYSTDLIPKWSLEELDAPPEHSYFPVDRKTTY